KPPTPDRDWNKTLPAIQGSAQTWISKLAKQADSRFSFNELLDTPIDFSNFIMNWLCVDTLTPEVLAGPTYELMRGSCTSLTDLEYHLEEVYKATTDQLDWVNPEGRCLKPKRYKICDKDKGGKLRAHQFYGFAVNRESALDEYSKRRIIAVIDLKIVAWHNYKHLDWISIRPDLSEMELKKILIEKMEGNKSIQRSDEQRNRYKALVEDYDADKTILDTYGESTILKRR
nr:hypothetical protein [Tanacetum cinerariifolium]